MTRARSMVVATVLVALVGLSVAEARNHLSGRRGGGAGAEQQEQAADEGRMEIRASGVTPVFPRDAVCPEIASPFGSHTRYDGSRRPMDRFGGLHGGIDISLSEGTPLLAIAAGKVVAVGTGAMFTGHYLWLQHAPDDTGLPFWVYAKYQHFRDLPDTPIGAAVKAGQVVGMSGKTGTTGRHYGMTGYPHLHLTTFAGGGERYETRDSSVVVAGARIVDPVTIYVRGPEKTATIAYVGDDGVIRPEGSRMVWPVPCKRR
jgi:murein DD-endopeptidase MepM/ murein hydrolase activator NlpD